MFKIFKKTIKSHNVEYTLEQFVKLQMLNDLYKDNEPLLYSKLSEVLFNKNKVSVIEANEGIKKFKDILDKPAEFKHRFWFEGVEYGFIPNLNNISVGEFIDLSNLEEDTIGNASRIMSILYRPITKRIGESYEIEPYSGSEKYMNVFKNVDYSIYVGAVLFFCNLSKDLLSHSDISFLK